MFSTVSHLAPLQSQKAINGFIVLLWDSTLSLANKTAFVPVPLSVVLMYWFLNMLRALELVCISVTDKKSIIVLVKFLTVCLLLLTCLYFSKIDETM